jgi:magnesium-transporting ATPase (P-type)
MTVTLLSADGQFVHVTGTGYVPKGDFLANGETVDISKYPAILTALWLGLLNNHSSIETTGEDDSQKTYSIVGDPTEGALVVAAAKAGATHVEIKEAYPRENEVPFDSERKRMMTSPSRPSCCKAPDASGPMASISTSRQQRRCPKVARLRSRPMGSPRSGTGSTPTSSMHRR